MMEPFDQHHHDTAKARAFWYYLMFSVAVHCVLGGAAWYWVQQQSQDNKMTVEAAERQAEQQKSKSSDPTQRGADESAPKKTKQMEDKSPEEAAAEQKEEERKAAEAARKMMEENLRELTKEALEKTLEEFMKNQDEKVPDNLKAVIDEKMKEFLESLDVDSVADKDIEQTVEQWSKQWQEELKTLLDAMQKQVSDELIKKTVEQTAAAMIDNVNKKLRDQLSGKVDEKIKQEFNTGPLAEQLKKTPYKERDALYQEIAKAALDPIHQYADKRLTETVSSQLQAAADKLIEAARKSPAGQMPEVQQKFGAMLKEELKKADFDETVVTLRTRDRMKLMDPTSIQELPEQMRKMSRQMSSWQAEQQKVSDAASNNQVEDVKEMHASQTEKWSQLETQTNQMLDKTRNNVQGLNSEIQRAGEATQYRKANYKLEQIGYTLQRKDMPAAARQSDEAAQMASNSAKGLLALADAVDKQIQQQAQTASSQSSSPSNAISSEQFQAKQSAVQQAAFSAIDSGLQQAVGQAMQSSGQISGLLSKSSLASQFAAIMSMQQGLGASSGALGRSGESMSDVMQMASALNPVEGLPDAPGGLPIMVRSQFNLKTYQEFVSRLKERKANAGEPDAAETPSAAWTKAPERTQNVAAAIIENKIPPLPTPDKPKSEDLPKPDFESVALAAAEMMDKPVQIDGDLSDWGTLKHPIQMQYGANGNRLTNGPVIYMRWSPGGLYFAGTIKDDNGILPCPNQIWIGDALEVWLDTLNTRRKYMADTPSSHQLYFTPFGYQGDARSTFSEYGRGARGLKTDVNYPDTEKKRGWSAAKVIPGFGYSIEGFVSVHGLADASLKAGRYLAVNFSVNQGDYESHFQWAASKAVGTWNKPLTWGDVLLLGSDASTQMAAIKTDDPERKTIAVGESVEITITDADMNVDIRRPDLISAYATVGGSSDALLLILEETGTSTGVFKATFGTQSIMQEARENCLRVRAGDVIDIVYTDLWQSKGQKNVVQKTRFAVGWPVMMLAQQ